MWEEMINAHAEAVKSTKIAACKNNSSEQNFTIKTHGVSEILRVSL